MLNYKIKETRIDKELKTLIEDTLILLNANSARIEFHEADLIRMAVKDFCEKTKSEGLSISFVPKFGTNR